MQKYIATGRLDKVFVDYVTPNPTWISSLLLWYLFILNFMNLSWRTWYLLFLCKMVINKTILMAISLSNRSCPYEFNASIDCWLKTTSHYDVIAPSTVSTTQNAKLPPSSNLCHSLMLCHVTAHGDGVGWGGVGVGVVGGQWNTSATHLLPLPQTNSHIGFKTNIKTRKYRI